MAEQKQSKVEDFLIIYSDEMSRMDFKGHTKFGFLYQDKFTHKKWIRHFDPENNRSIPEDIKYRCHCMTHDKISFMRNGRSTIVFEEETAVKRRHT